MMWRTDLPVTLVLLLGLHFDMYQSRPLEPVVLLEVRVGSFKEATAECKKFGGKLPTPTALERRYHEQAFTSCECGWSFRGALARVGCKQDVSIVGACDIDNESNYPIYCQMVGDITTQSPTTTKKCIPRKNRKSAVLTEDCVSTYAEAKYACEDFDGGQIAAEINLSRRYHDDGFTSCKCGWTSTKQQLITVGCGSGDAIKVCKKEPSELYPVYCLAHLNKTTTSAPTTSSPVTATEPPVVTVTTTEPPVVTVTTTEPPVVTKETTVTPTVTTETERPPTTPMPTKDELARLVVKSESIKSSLGDIFHIRLTKGHYLLKSRDEAAKFCSAVDASLATLPQLESAWNAGMDNCFCGWLDSGIVRYPVNNPTPQCASVRTIATCPEDFTSYHERGWDAYCVTNSSL